MTLADMIKTMPEGTKVARKDDSEYLGEVMYSQNGDEPYLLLQNGVQLLNLSDLTSEDWEVFKP